ncbi:hypothetical protein Tco_0631052 [Tanacetum coccineum]
MIKPSSSRYSSNDMVHNHYLEEAKKKTHKSGRNSRPNVMPFAKSQSTANGHSRNSSNFSDSKHFVCSTCQKCVFNANHDACVTKFLNEVNSRAKVPSHKTTNRNKPEKQIRVAKKPERRIPQDIGTPFNLKKERIMVLIKGNVISGRPRGSNTLSWKPCQGGSSKLNLPDHSLIPTESNSIPHAHAQTTKTYYKHQDSRIKKAQELKIKTSANSDIKDTSSETKLRGRLLASFQDDAKYEHVGQDIRSQDGKDDKDNKEKM